jgi:hypothetical protein
MSYIGNTPTSIAFLTDTFSGDGTTVGYTMTVAPANTSSIIVAVTGVLQDPSTYSVSGTTLTFSAAPPSGTSNISVRYLGIPASGVTTTAYRTVTNFTATAGQTSFSVPSYTVGYIDVYRNGVRLVSTDFTATTGTTVVLNNACTVGDAVVTESFLVSSVLNAIPATAGAVNSTYIAAGAVGTTQIAASTTLTTPKVTTTIGVGNATPSGSGSGITFPATQSASSDANTLDDYEEGTFTPAITYSGTSTATYTARSGYYTKVGNLVTLSLYISFSEATSTGNVTITGLPFTSKNITLNRIAVSVFSFGWVGTSISLTGQIIENEAQIRLYLNDNGGTVVTASNTDTDQDIYIGASYFAA